MPDEPIIALRKKLREIKDSNGHTVGQMAGEAGLNETTLWRVMRGQRSPSFDTFVALLRTFPQVRAIFLPPDSPGGKEPLPTGTMETQA